MTILVLAGEGGHKSQALKFIDECKGIYETNLMLLPDVRSKQTGRPLVSGLIKVFMLCGKNINIDYDIVISFGPASSVIFIAIRRLLRSITLQKDEFYVHIESWSRFYKLSMTSKISKLFCHQLYLQNANLDPAAKNLPVIGRLG